MPQVLGVEYKVFGPGNFYDLAKKVQREKLVIPSTKEVMTARVSITEKRKDFKWGEKRGPWLDKSIYTSDGVFRWKNHENQDLTDVVRAIPIETWLSGTRTKEGNIIYEERIAPWEIYSQADVNTLQIPTKEVRSYWERKVFQNLRMEEIVSNMVWNQLAAGDANLLEHYIGSMALEVQRRNTKGISSIMGIYIHDMQVGELSPLIMAPPSYDENASVASQGTYHRWKAREAYIIGLEKRLPGKVFDNAALKAQREKAPLAGAMSAGLRHLSAIMNTPRRKNN